MFDRLPATGDALSPTLICRNGSSPHAADEGYGKENAGCGVAGRIMAHHVSPLRPAARRKSFSCLLGAAGVLPVHPMKETASRIQVSELLTYDPDPFDPPDG